MNLLVRIPVSLDIPALYKEIGGLPNIYKNRDERRNLGRRAVPSAAAIPKKARIRPQVVVLLFRCFMRAFFALSKSLSSTDIVTSLAEFLFFSRWPGLAGDVCLQQKGGEEFGLCLVLESPKNFQTCIPPSTSIHFSRPPENRSGCARTHRPSRPDRKKRGVLRWTPLGFLRCRLLADGGGEIPPECVFHGFDEGEALAGEETDHGAAARADVGILGHVGEAGGGADGVAPPPITV